MSLVEILVALTIGVFLLAGIIQVLTSGRATYRLAEAQARAQENGRYAIQFLARELRPSRSYLCRNIASEELHVAACALLQDPVACTGAVMVGSRTPLGYSTAQHGTANWLAQLPGGTATGTRGGVDAHWLRGDVLVSWGTVGESLYAQRDTLKQGTTVNTTLPVRLSGGLSADELADAGFRGGRMAMISDCLDTHVFTITNTQPVTGSLEHATTRNGTRVNQDANFNIGTGTFDRPYNDTAKASGWPRAVVAPFDLRVYFICCVALATGLEQTGDDVAQCNDDPVAFRPALCRWSASSGRAESVVLDVADLRATYDGRRLVGGGGNPVRFSDAAARQTADQLTSADWPQVYSTRVELLVTGGDEVRSTAVSPAAASSSGSGLGSGLADDRRIYESFSTTTANRARAPWTRDQ